MRCPFFDLPPRFRRIPGIRPSRRLIQDAASCPAASPAKRVRRLADEDQHTRRADKGVGFAKARSCVLLRFPFMSGTADLPHGFKCFGTLMHPLDDITYKPQDAQF